MNTGDVVDALAQLSWHVSARISDAAARHGVSGSQLRLLGILRDREPEMLELASHLGLDKSSVTGLVARAEARGLLERVPSTVDGRRVVVRMTDAGRALAAELEREVGQSLAPTIELMPSTVRTALVDLASAVRVAERTGSV